MQKAARPPLRNNPRPCLFCIRDWAFGVGRFLPPNPPTCIRPVIRHSYSQMSGMFFDNPGVRFSKRSSVCQSRLRLFASVLFRWLTGAGRRCFRINSRLHEAEFPPATQIAYRLLLRSVSGSRATDRASNDALRPNNNWVKPEDQYGISFIGEKWPAPTRRLPQKGRQQPPAPTECALARTGEANVLAKNDRLLHWRRRETGRDDETGSPSADSWQWLGAIAHAA